MKPTRTIATPMLDDDDKEWITIGRHQGRVPGSLVTMRIRVKKGYVPNFLKSIMASRDKLQSP